jgi:Ca-activated chloride channel family protein
MKSVSKLTAAVVALSSAALALSACSNGAPPGAADLGVTPGGSQDIGYARTIIEEGQVPARGEFSAEGLFSEHDLPFTSAPACGVVLCPYAASAVVEPVDGGERGALVHMGFLTNIDDDFRRGPLDLALAVDISGSMAGGDKMISTKQALTTLIAELNENDTLALVAFDDVAELRLTRRVMDEAGRAAALDVIEALAPDGATSIEAGLVLAYQQIVEVRTDADGVAVARRAMLFTDAMPNVGSTGEGEFVELVNEGADLNIGLSAFGVGLDFGAALTNAIAKTRGGNAFYLKDNETIASVFDEDFDLIVTPLAYDLTATVTRADSVTLRRAYGAPTDDQALNVEFSVSTLFLSRNRGGMGIMLNVPVERLPAALAGAQDPNGGAAEPPLPQPALPISLGVFHLSYELANVELVERELDVVYRGGSQLGGQQTEADDLGVYKMAVLVDEFLALEAAADGCSGALDAQSALGRVTAAQERLVARAAQLNDAALEVESVLLTKLSANFASGTGCREPIVEEDTLQ